MSWSATIARRTVRRMPPNVIANNRGAGVSAINDANVSNSVLSNSIYNNHGTSQSFGLGISLVGGTEDAYAVTANDSGDADIGPNRLQNYPVITAATRFLGGGTTITGTLQSSKKKKFIIQFFGNTVADPSGYGEGKTYLGSVNVKTDKNGDATFSFGTEGLSLGQFVTATATNKATGDTSEFSNARVVELPVIGP